MEEFIPMRVQKAHVVSGPTGKLLQMESDSNAPSIAGVEVTQVQTFINKRRELVVSHNSQERPGTLSYSGVVRSGCALNDHYHHKREERIVILHGQEKFRLQDCRPLSASHQLINLFTLDYPCACVRIPAGVCIQFMLKMALWFYKFWHRMITIPPMIYTCNF
ncbi:MAG: hypothetical protein ABI210_00075 [Abditibacteriaceae bacterium]